MDRGNVSALARALLTDPAILLLDDPVSAVDPETEHEILSAFSNASRGRTTLIVAHRLSTLRGADRVIVLDQGQIVQEGTHRQLLAQAGPYRLVAESQGIEIDPAPSTQTPRGGKSGAGTP